MWVFTDCASASTSSAYVSDEESALSSSRFVIDSAIGGPAAMVAASVATASSSSLTGTTALTIRGVSARCGEQVT